MWLAYGTIQSLIGRMWSTTIKMMLIIANTSWAFFFKILFIYSWERHRQREKQAPCREPNVGLDPRSPGSSPGPKADAQPLSHPGVPVFILSFHSNLKGIGQSLKSSTSFDESNIVTIKDKGWPTWIKEKSCIFPHAFTTLYVAHVLNFTLSTVLRWETCLLGSPSQLF